MKTLRFSPALTLLTLLLPASAFAQNQPPRPSAADLEAPILTWTNMARMQQGKAPLRVNDDLTRAAKQHARNMANQEVMSHTLDGDTLADRVRRTGYRHAGVAENIAFVGGYAYPAWAFFDGWMRSEGHHRNLMNDQYTEIGVGVARSESGKYYACQVFGRPGGAPQYMPAPSPYVGGYMVPAPHGYVPATPYGVYPTPQPRQQPAPQMMPYSPYTGAPVWLRPASQAQPVNDDIHWYGPWDWRD